MFNPKNIGIFAGIGFTLSFITGLISSNTIGHCFINAIVFALVFGLLSVGISFIYQKFLSVDQTESFSSSEAGGQPVVQRGANVDITLGDDNLPEEDGDPKFVVSIAQSSLSNSSEMASAVKAPPGEEVPVVAKESGVTEMKDENVRQDVELDVIPEAAEHPRQTEDAPKKEDSSFVPINLGQKEDVSKPAQKDSLGEISQLPDIGELAPDDDDDEEDDSVDGVIDDSDFASAGQSSSSHSDGNPSVEQNAAVMAKAISTFLSRE